MRHLSCTNTSYEHLAKKVERAVLPYVGRDGLEMSICLRSFFVCLRFLASENGLYELANMFCHVGPGSYAGGRWGMGAEPPALEKFYLFAKIN